MDQAMGMLVKSNDPIALKVVVAIDAGGDGPNSRPICTAPAARPGSPRDLARVIMSEDELADRPAGRNSGRGDDLAELDAGVLLHQGGGGGSWRFAVARGDRRT